MKKGFLLFLFIIFFTSINAQTTYSWRSEAGDGTWNNSTHWWDGGATNTPGGGEILYFNNDARLSMTNDLVTTNRYQILFGNGGTSARTLGGSTKNTFYDFGGNNPKIENNSTGSHSISFPIEIGHNPIEINPVSGPLTISGTITQENSETNFIDVFGTNTLTITSDYQGGGGVVLKQAGTLVFSTIAKTYTGTTTLDAGTLNTSVDMASATITVKNGAKIEINGDVSVKNLTIESGGTLEILGGASLTVEGDLVIDGTFTHNSRSVTFAGSAAQNISGGSAIEFASVTINNSNGVTLSQSISITTQLSFTTGKITLGSNNLTLNNSATFTGNSSSNYIVTDGTGVLTRNSVGGTDTEFPVGTATNYNPITINNAGTSDNFSVRVKTAFTNTPTDATKVVNVAWDITEAVSGGTDATITIEWTAAQEESSFDRTKSLHIGRHTGAAWEHKSATLAGADPYTASASNFTDFSEFGVGSEEGLPVQLTKFIATPQNNQVSLDWQTVIELDNDFFVIEKSTIGSDFEAIGTVQGAGTTVEIQNYNFIDAQPVTGMNYYRLKQVDFDGNFEYSNLAVIKFEKKEPIKVFPNPVKEEISIQANLGQTHILIYNMQGQLLREMNDISINGQFTFNLNELNVGLYQIQILDASTRNILLQERIVKQ